MVCKEPLTECFFVEPKMVLLWHHLKNLFKHLYFKSVYLKVYFYILETVGQILSQEVFK